MILFSLGPLSMALMWPLRPVTVDIFVRVKGEKDYNRKKIIRFVLLASVWKIGENSANLCVKNGPLTWICRLESYGTRGTWNLRRRIMNCHQILSGACNAGDRCFAVGSVEGVPFTVMMMKMLSCLAFPLCFMCDDDDDDDNDEERTPDMKSLPNLSVLKVCQIVLAAVGEKCAAEDVNSSWPNWVRREYVICLIFNPVSNSSALIQGGKKIYQFLAEDSEDLTSIIGFYPKLQHPRNYWSEMKPKSLLLGLSSKKRITFGSHLTDKKFSPFIEYTQTTNTGAGAKSMKL